jgi:hypothetical protein
VGDVNIDLTPPTVSARRDPEANANGWVNAPVTVSFTCADALSGVLDGPADVILAGEGAGQRASGMCTDNAGNAATATASGINIDLTPPELSSQLDGTQGDAGWWRSPVDVTLPCTDALSGLGSGAVVYRANGGDDVPYDGAFNVSAEGDNAVDATCTDQAGNARSLHLDVRIDTRPPSGSVDAPPVALLGPYAVNWTALDPEPGSGVVGVEVQERALLGLLGGNWTTVCTADGAGEAATNGTCVRDPPPGQYCYRVVVRDVAGNDNASEYVDAKHIGGIVGTCVAKGPTIEPAAALVEQATGPVATTRRPEPWLGAGANT